VCACVCVCVSECECVCKVTFLVHVLISSTPEPIASPHPHIIHVCRRLNKVHSLLCLRICTGRGERDRGGGEAGSIGVLGGGEAEDPLLGGGGGSASSSASNSLPSSLSLPPPFLRVRLAASSTSSLFFPSPSPPRPFPSPPHPFPSSSLPVPACSLGLYNSALKGRSCSSVPMYLV
jgi:hypothetical protein